MNVFCHVKKFRDFCFGILLYWRQYDHAEPLDGGHHAGAGTGKLGAAIFAVVFNWPMEFAGIAECRKWVAAQMSRMVLAAPRFEGLANRGWAAKRLLNL